MAAPATASPIPTSAASVVQALPITSRPTSGRGPQCSTCSARCAARCGPRWPNEKGGASEPRPLSDDDRPTGTAYAARTLLRKSSTSALRRLLSFDSDCAEDSTCEEAAPVSPAPRL